MSNGDNEGALAGTNGEVPADDKSALFDQLKEIRKNLVETEFVQDFDIPGYNGMLVVRCRPYEISKSERKAMVLRERSSRGESVLLDAACDTIIDATEQVMVRKPNGEIVPIDDELPVKWDERLSQLLGLNVPPPPQGTARMVVKTLFPTEQSITALSMEITTWLRDATKGLDQAVLGE